MTDNKDRFKFRFIDNPFQGKMFEFENKTNKDFSDEARWLLYVLYEIKNQLTTEQKRELATGEKSGIEISQKRLVFLLRYSYSTKDQREYSRNKISLVIEELEKIVEIEDLITTASCEGRFINIGISKASRNAQVYYNVIFPRDVVFYQFGENFFKNYKNYGVCPYF